MQDGDETDIDCGGGTCPTCATGALCVGNVDCQSGVCAGGVCAAPSCTDRTEAPVKGILVTAAG